MAETQPTPTSPTSTTTKVSEENSLINLQPLWDKGIKGQGQVVAIIDSGVDPAHDVFRLTDISKAKYKSEAEIEEAKKKRGSLTANGTTIKLSTFITTVIWTTMSKKTIQFHTGLT